MATQWPRVVNRLVELLPTLSGWEDVAVIDGLPLTADIAGDCITVGYVSDDSAGNYSVTQNTDGFQWNETGQVRMEMDCFTGDTDISAMRSRMFGLVDAFEASVRADRTLGGTLSREGTSDLQVDVRSVQDVSGAVQSAVLVLTYFTVT
jgi:hypothetical protein